MASTGCCGRAAREPPGAGKWPAIVEESMGKIIRFPLERANSAGKAMRVMEGPTADIIIFPGIRFERSHGDLAIAK
jgi:hypothetical protein